MSGLQTILIVAGVAGLIHVIKPHSPRSHTIDVVRRVIRPDRKWWQSKYILKTEKKTYYY
jgi:hypothetical protein